MNKGFIRIDRSLLDHVIWANATPEQRVILITLLLMVNHAPNEWEWKNESYNVQAGQVVTSVRKIKEKCNCEEITDKKVRTALERLKKLGFIEMQTSSKNTLITIKNWGKYQNTDEENRGQTKGKQKENKGQTEGKQKENESKTEGKQRATNKNENNENNENNYKYIGTAEPSAPNSKNRFVKPTIFEIAEYCRERNNFVDAERFFSYYESNGWKVGKNPMKDWKAAVRTWEKNEYGNKKGKQEGKQNGSIYEQREYTEEFLEAVLDRKAEGFFSSEES